MDDYIHTHPYIRISMEYSCDRKQRARLQPRKPKWPPRLLVIVPNVCPGSRYDTSMTCPRWCLYILATRSIDCCTHTCMENMKLCLSEDIAAFCMVA